MKKFFLTYSTILCVLFAFKVLTGKSVFEQSTIKKWSPAGHSMHHK
jgi:hypothetical protein